MNHHPNPPPEGRFQRTCPPSLRPCILNTPHCLLLGYLRSWPPPALVANNFSLLYTCGRHAQPSGWACQCGHLQPPHLLRILGNSGKCITFSHQTGIPCWVLLSTPPPALTTFSLCCHTASQNSQKCQEHLANTTQQEAPVQPVTDSKFLRAPWDAKPHSYPHHVTWNASLNPGFSREALPAPCLRWAGHSTFESNVMAEPPCHISASFATGLESVVKQQSEQTWVQILFNAHTG